MLTRDYVMHANKQMRRISRLEVEACSQLESVEYCRYDGNSIEMNGHGMTT
jgi:hypothetical protein